MSNIIKKTRKTLWSLNQGQNTNTTRTTTTTTTTTFMCYLCWHMLLQNDICFDEAFGLMEPSYLQCHIMFIRKNLHQNKSFLCNIIMQFWCTFKSISNLFFRMENFWMNSNLSSQVQMIYFYFFKFFQR